MDWRLSFAGLFVGALVGATGMGGGSLITPLLVLGFGFNPSVAVGTDILHGAIFKSVGALRHRRLGTVHGRLSGWMLLGSAPTSIAGVALATWLRHRYGNSPGALGSVIVGGALAAGGVGLLAKSLIGDNRARPAEYVLTRRDRVAAVLIGLFGGFIVGLTSVGTGVFFGLTMLIVFPLRSAKVVGTDVFHAAALLWVAGAAHLVAGNVDSRAVAALLAGSIPGVLIGSRQTLRLDERTLRASLAVVLLGSGVALAARPAPLAGPLVALCVAVPVAIALRRGRRALAVATPPIRQPAHATPSLPASRDLAVSARARAR